MTAAQPSKVAQQTQAQRQADIERHRPLFNNAARVTLGEGDLIRYDGRIWFVGLVNQSRARLDPVTGSDVNLSDPVSGKASTFRSYGGSISICPQPGSPIVEVDLDTLDDTALNRLARLMETYEAERIERDKREAQHEKEQARLRRNWAHSQPVAPADEDIDMEAQEAVGEAAAMPIAAKNDKAAANKARLAAIKAKQAAKPASKGAAAMPTKGGVVKGAAVNRGPRSKDNVCKCGCGGSTAGHFVPGHDARFKGWLKKIEKGEATPEALMGKKVAAQYEWKKVGKGLRPTLDYKGEKYVSLIQ